MREVVQKVYQFDELSDDAKDRACDWFRQGMEVELYTEWITTAFKLLGFEPHTKAIPLMNGTSRREPDYRYSVGGRGDYFTAGGYWRYRPHSVADIKAEFPQDFDLHKLAERWATLQRQNFYQLVAVITTGRTTVSAEVERTDDKPTTASAWEETNELSAALMQWAETHLRLDFEYQMSDDAVAENIRVNEYEFDERGNHV